MIASLLILGMALFTTAELAVAHTDASALSARPNATAERLTHSLVTLSAQYQAADATEQPPLLSQLITIALARQRLLTTLINQNPGAVLRVALPANIRSSLPPIVQDYMEEVVQLEGRL